MKRDVVSSRMARANNFEKQPRVQCGARRRSDGQPCEASNVPGRARCKWHGGASTGPRTTAGKEKVRLNLPHPQLHDAKPRLKK